MSTYPFLVYLKLSLRFRFVGTTTGAAVDCIFTNQPGSGRGWCLHKPPQLQQF